MYDKIKRITIWIPALGIVLMLMFDKKLHKSMYYEYFSWGHPILVFVSALWQILSVFYILSELIFPTY